MLAARRSLSLPPAEAAEEGSTTFLISGSTPNLRGAIRLRHWPAGRVPAKDWERLSMDLFPFLGRHAIGEICHPWLPVQGSLANEALGPQKAAYQLLAQKKGCALIFCTSPPRDLAKQRAFGLRPFGGRPLRRGDGHLVPLVAIPSDLDFYEQVGSPLAAEARRLFGPGGRPAVDLTPFGHLLTGGRANLERWRPAFSSPSTS